MSSEWREVAVEDLKARSENALATGPFGSSIASRFFTDRGVPVIRGSNLSENVGIRLNEERLVFLSFEKAQEFNRSIVRDGDLVFTCWGTVNQVGLIDRRATYREYVISNKQMKLTPEPSKADSLFLYYLFSSPELQNRIRNQSIGSSVPGFNLGQLRKMRISLPEIEEQRAISYLLGTLDDKIELARRMAETLEAMARALFRSWFVDFDPVHAKAEGRPTGLPDDLAALFPDRFGDLAAPLGWKLVTLDNLVELAYGKALPADQRINGSVPVFGSNGQVGVHNHPLVPGPGIVVERKGNPGTVTYVPSDFFCIDTTFYVLRRNRDLPISYLWLLLENLPLFELAADSAVPGLNRDAAYSLRVSRPSAAVLQAFDSVVEPILKRVQAARMQGEALASLRDTLLPKLISGELRITNAEKRISAA
jgi:restriction endonuclease S subunit